MSDWLSSNISPPRLGESYFRSPLPTRREVPVVVSIAVTVVYKAAPPVRGAAAEINNQKKTPLTAIIQVLVVPRRKIP